MKAGSTPNAAKVPPCAQRSSLLVTRFASFAQNALFDVSRPTRLLQILARGRSISLCSGLGDVACESRAMRADLRACCSHFAVRSPAHCSGGLRPQQLSLRHTGPASSHPFEHQPDRVRPGFAGKSRQRARGCAAQEGSWHRSSTGIEGPRTYSAFEPDLLLWVLATLITAAINGYELIYGELSIARKEAFYRDMCRFGTYFGVTESLSPKDWPAFDAYYTSMVEGSCWEATRSAANSQEPLFIHKTPSPRPSWDAPSTLLSSRHCRPKSANGSA